MLNDALPTREVFYDPFTSGKCYFVRNSRDNFIPVTEANVKRMLKGDGLSAEVGKSDLLSEVDAFMNTVQHDSDVDYAGPLAGHKTGHFIFQGRRILVTESPKFIDPVGSPWPTLEGLFRGLLVPCKERDGADIGDVQLWHLYSWLKVAMSALRAGKRRPGQALIIAGPPGCGKSLVQNLITKLLGGRSAKPYQYMIGGTQFNSELFHAEHLMIEDEAASFDYRIRVKTGAMLKSLLVNEDQRCHPKNRPALTLRPWWRVSITLNDDPESLLVMPPIDGVEEKVMLMRAYKAALPMPTETLEQWGAFMACIEAELPAFVHFILHEWQIPGDMRDNRYGVTHFHHAELLQMMSVLAPETKLLELIDTKLFPKDAAFPAEWEGKASDLEAELCGPSSAVAHEARKLLLYNSACGQLLGRLKRLYPDRISDRISKGYTFWQIQPPPSVKA